MYCSNNTKTRIQSTSILSCASVCSCDDGVPSVSSNHVTEYSPTEIIFHFQIKLRRNLSSKFVFTTKKSIFFVSRLNNPSLSPSSPTSMRSKIFLMKLIF